MTEIKYEDLGHKGRYYYIEGSYKAELTFVRSGESQIIIDHTEVPQALQGRGIALNLVRHAVEEARRQNLLIRPLCPYAASAFKKHPEWQDMLAL